MAFSLLGAMMSKLLKSKTPKAPYVKKNRNWHVNIPGNVCFRTSFEVQMFLSREQSLYKIEAQGLEEEKLECVSCFSVKTNSQAGQSSEQ